MVLDRPRKGVLGKEVGPSMLSELRSLDHLGMLNELRSLHHLGVLNEARPLVKLSGKLRALDLSNCHRSTHRDCSRYRGNARRSWR